MKPLDTAILLSIFLRWLVTFVPVILILAFAAYTDPAEVLGAAATDLAFVTVVYALLVIPTLPTPITPEGGSILWPSARPFVVPVALGAFIGMWTAFAPMIGIFPFFSLALLVGDMELPFWVLTCMVSGAALGLLYYGSGFLVRPLVGRLPGHGK